MRLSFEIPGPPGPKARPRVTRRGAFTPEKTKDYEEQVGWAAMVAVRQRPLPKWPVDAEYGIDCVFYFKGRPACDGDNCLKSVQDGLEKVLYTNDKQVVEGHYRTRKGADVDKTVITIWTQD